jgi:hypothetical protein
MGMVINEVKRKAQNVMSDFPFCGSDLLVAMRKNRVQEHRVQEHSPTAGALSRRCDKVKRVQVT